MRKTILTILASVAFLIFVAAFLVSSFLVKAARVTCSSFADQGAAQRFYNLDRHKYGALDADDDGWACEGLPEVILNQ